MSSSSYFEINHTQVMQNLGFKQFDNIRERLAFNVMTYGAALRKLSRMGRYVHTCFFYILEEDDGILQWLSQKKMYQKSRIQLQSVTHIYESVPEVYRQSVHFNTACLLRIVTSESMELVLLFDSIEDKLIWWQGLQVFILRAMDRQMMGNPAKNMVAQLFRYGDKDSNLILSFDEVKRVIQRMHIQINAKYLKEFYRKYDVNRNGTIEKEEFECFIQDLMEKEELKSLFRKYHKDTEGQGMSFFSLQEFFEREQHQKFTIQEIQNVAQQLGEQNDSISFFTFVNIIFSPHNTVIDSSRFSIEHDMSHPLTYYYIHSSHNTYLLSNQLTGKSSLQAYINAFKRGVKCVELDCWDGKDGEPVVYHGHTLTSKIYFQDILKCVLEYGFCMSPYPVLLSLEIHCGSVQQQVMAKYLKQILKDHLFQVPQDHAKVTYFPSPNDLRNKVILKGVGKLQHLFGEQNINIEETEQPDSEESESLEHIFEKGAPQMLPTDLSITKQNTIVVTDEYMSIQDEISYEEHNLKHKVPSPPKLSSSVYTNFNLNNPDFNNFINYHQFLQKQSKSFLNTSRFSDNSPFQIEHGSWVNEQQWTARSNHQKDNGPIRSPTYRAQKSVKQSVDTPPKPSIINTTSVSQWQQYPPKSILKTDKDQTKPNRGTVVLPQERSSSSNIQAGNGVQYLQTRKGKQSVPKSGKKKTIVGTHIELERCLALFSAKLSFDPKREVWLITSLSETQLEVLQRKNQTSLVKYHRRFFSRIYPKGTRFDSSNYDPMPGFVVGSQIIALNYQTNDENLLLNMTMFQLNRNQGYVLKPHFLIKDPKINKNDSIYEDPSLYFNNLFKRPKVRILIHFISAQQLRPENEKSDQDVVDPYIDVQLKGIQIDETSNMPKRSNIVKNNGFNPIFNFTVDFQISCPDLAFIIVKVFDKDVLQDDRLGMNVVSVMSLRRGYRVLPLLDSKLNQIENCYLFLHLEIFDLGSKQG